MTTTDPTPRTNRTAEPRRESLLADFTLAPISAAERRQAAIAVCERAETADDARELLEALGLLDVTILKGAA
jgi:hypothetical protein